MILSLILIFTSRFHTISLVVSGDVAFYRTTCEESRAARKTTKEDEYVAQSDVWEVLVQVIDSESRSESRMVCGLILHQYIRATDYFDHKYY